MDENWSEIESIIDKALTLSGDERKTFINDKCEGDAKLKKEVTKFLQFISDSEGWLENPSDLKDDILRQAPSEATLSSLPNSSLIGEEIGSYLVTKKIGSGGMGSVYLAERSDGEFEHQVAIKIIRNEKATAENIRRFEQERTILAGLNHSGIAKLFDGGITNDGFPYFVMEYVDGIPIDQYCKENQVSIPERVALFKKVLVAVRHAHENLVVHRDLKPSNILVTPSKKVKILDFGISKLLRDGQSAEAGLTQTNARLLTPKYAAPEQILQLSITTATDIYALGIVFYALLTDRYPFDLDKLSQFEIEQSILEIQPQKPSTTVSDSNLQKQLQGDLDDIALKAIRKEGDQRYRSANEFLDDLDRFQRGLPVIAGDDTLRYRARKFINRHTQAVVTAFGIFILIIGFAGFYTHQITKERNKAQLQSERAEEMTSFLLSLFEANNPRENQDQDFPVSKIIERGLERLNNKPISTESKAILLGSIAQIQLNIGRSKEAGRIFKKAYQLASDSVEINSSSIVDIYTAFASWQRVSGTQDSALALLQKADSLHHSLGTTTSEEYRINLVNLANIHNQNGNYEEALRTLGKLEYFPENEQNSIHNKSYYFNNIAAAYSGLGKYDLALKHYEQSIALKEKIYNQDNPELGLSYNNVAFVYLGQDLFQRAYELFKKAYEIRLNAYGPDHQLLGATLSGLATSANRIGKAKESLQYHNESLRVIKKHYGTDHYRYAFALRNYAIYLIDSGAYEKAENVLNESHSITTKTYGSDHVINGSIINTKADLYHQWGKPNLANDHYKSTLDIFKDNYGSDYSRLAKVYSGYAILKYKQKEYKKAIKLFKTSNDVFESNGNDYSTGYGKNLYYLGKTYFQLGNRELAQSYLHDAYQIISKIKGDTTQLSSEIEEMLSGIK